MGVSAGLLTLVSAVIVVLFDRWVQLHDRIYFPAVEAPRVAVYPTGSSMRDGFSQLGLRGCGHCGGDGAVVAPAPAATCERVGHGVWFALSIGMALTVALFATPPIALPFIVSALIALCVVIVRHRSAESVED
jgi:hypothetical protein